MRPDPRAVIIDVLPDGAVRPPRRALPPRLIAYGLFGLALAGFAASLAFFLAIAIALLPVIAALAVGLFLWRSLYPPGPRVPQSLFH